MLLALLFAVTLGSDDLSVDVTSTPYRQESRTLELPGPFVFGESFSGEFKGSGLDWTSVDTIYLDAFVEGSNPAVSFTLGLFRRDGDKYELINSYAGSTSAFGATAASRKLELLDTGSGDFSRIDGIQLTWSEAGNGGSLIIRSLIGSGGTIVPMVTSTSYSPGLFRMTWSGTGAVPVNVERRSSLSSGQWTVVAQGIVTGEFSDTNPPAGQAFYRLAVP